MTNKQTVALYDNYKLFLTEKINAMDVVFFKILILTPEYGTKF